MSEVTYEPLKGYVIIAPFSREAETNSGIVLEAEPKANNNTEGVVREMNPIDEQEERLPYSEGAVVSFVTGASIYEKQVQHEGEQCYILPLSNVIAVVS